MGRKPSNKKHLVFEALQFCIEQGEQPTVRELGTLAGISSPGTVLKHLHELEQDGLITMTGRKSRSIRIRGREGLLPGASQEGTPGIPVVGQVAAGLPLEAIPEEGTLEIPINPELFAGSGDLMALRVSGDSMIEAGILNGDYVIIRRQPFVENGEIAAVEIDGAVTLKRWQRSNKQKINNTVNNTVRLIPANERFEPIEITSADQKAVRVLGKYMGLVRGEIRLS